MRLVQVGKILGMTGQQLRHELEQVNFGVKPTDREIPDNLAFGVIRFLARKHNIMVDPSVFSARTDESMAPMTAPDGVPAPKDAVALHSDEHQKQDNVHVLRKLTLDDVPALLIAKQQAKNASLTPEEKAEREREKIEQQALVQRKKPSQVSNQQQIKEKTGPVELPAVITVKEFAEKAGIQVPKIISALMKNGVMATITQSIDFDTAAIIAGDLGVTVEREQGNASVEDLLSKNLDELLKDEPENLQVRPPIVVVMGHVDHGKTSILDVIRQTDVVSAESGGITQHIGAYQVSHAGKLITFLDTPGHEAFASMRARGAQITDIAILVVSAAEGVKATTIEAINHAKDAGVPIIVALNKIDLPTADPERIKGELAGHGLSSEEWGGDTPFIPCSALTKAGIPQLLDTILLLADIHPCTANPQRSAVGTVIESHLDSALGPLATVIINTGTLKLGDPFICGRSYGKVRIMHDALGAKLADVPPSGAVRIAGCDSVPNVGDILQVVSSERMARNLLDEVLTRLGGQTKKAAGDLVTMLSEGKLKQLKIVLKADANGSLEALQSSLEKLGTQDVAVKVIHAAIGAVSESDVMMASASAALVISFRVDVSHAVMRTADREGVKVCEYDVIYKLLDDIQGLLTGLLVPEESEKIIGHLEVKGVFYAKKSEQIIGGRVLDGVIKRLAFRLMRGEQLVGQGKITSLKRAEQDIKEAKADSECGMRIETSIPVAVGDHLEVYVKEFKKKEA